MELLNRYLRLFLIMAMISQVTFAYDFKEGGLCFNFNEDGKSVTMTYETLILFAHDAPAPIEKGYIGDIIIPENVKYEGKTYKVTAIDRETFMGNSELYRVYIPTSVKIIGRGAFMHCNRLKEVILPPDLTEINDYMFAESGLQSIMIPNKVKKIGRSAFSNCYFKSINIPNSVETIGTSAFSACRWLEQVTLGNSVKTIGEAAFSICTKLTAINLPASLNEIGEKAFYECGNLTSVTIPASVSDIGAGAFRSCHKLTAINVEQANKRYDSRDNCNAIIETATNTLVVGCNGTTVPSRVTTIGTEAFYGCDGLKTADIPATVTEIGDHAFFYCKNIKTLDIPNSVTIIRDYAFVGCDSLEKVTIPNSVKVICGHAFLHDDHIKSLTIGSAVNYIGTWAFKGLDEVMSITSLIEDVNGVKMGKDVFDEIDKSSCKLYVPRGTADLYKAAPQWQDFKNIIEL